MLKILVLNILFMNHSFAMCEYPHNPPAVCLSGKITKSTPTKSKKYPCLLSVEVKEMIRPSGTYIFNSTLDRVDYKEPHKLSTKKIEIYSKSNCQEKVLRTIAEYNCNDRNSDLADMALIDAGSTRLKVRDPWTEKNPLIDCQSLLSK